MTTKVTVQAVCGDENEVVVQIDDGDGNVEAHILNNDTQREFYVYDDRLIAVYEQLKGSTNG